MRIEETAEYKSARQTAESKFDALALYAVEIEDFIRDHGAEHLTEPHRSAYPKVKTFKFWRNSKKIRRQMHRSAVKWARTERKQSAQVAKR